MKKNILVTGATGYIGGRIIPILLMKNYNVKILVRNKKRIENKRWYKDVQIHEGDILKKQTINGLFKNIDIAYYFIHSMAKSDDFDKNDIKAANIFTTAAKKENVNKIIYLGGLADNKSKLSKHLRSRLNTGDELRKSG